jgi:The  BURPS668_1122 family of deaminases
LNKEDLQTRKEDLRTRASLIRAVYLKKLTGSNVALADVYLFNDTSFWKGATSKGGGKSPIPQPKPKSEGGYFEPSRDSWTGRLMDTDAEYKVLSAIAETLDVSYDGEIWGNLYLYTELQPCQSCNDIIRQFKKKFPNISVHIFWDIPYPSEL